MSQTQSPQDPATEPGAAERAAAGGPTAVGVAATVGTVPSVTEPVNADVAPATAAAAGDGATPIAATAADPGPTAAAIADVDPRPDAGGLPTTDPAADAPTPPPGGGRGVRTYRGRTLEELLPAIREELGEEAVILRRREGLTGGVGGFFQQRFVEVEAVSGDGFRFDALDDEAATPEAVVDEPTPLGRRGYAALPGVGATVQDPDDRRPAAPPGTSGGVTLGGPDFLDHLDAARQRIRERIAPEAAPPASGIDVARRGVEADVAEYGLVARGLPTAIARSVVAEAADHGQPLDAGQRLDRSTRAVLARRLPRMAARTQVRTIAIVGAPGAGRTTAIGALARAYATAGRRTLVAALDADDGGAALTAALVGTEVEVLVTRSGEAIATAVRAQAADVCLVDAPAVEPGDGEAARGLMTVLTAAGVDEIHLALSATDDGPTVAATVSGLAALRPVAIVMTRRDLTEQPGTTVGISIERQLPISYVSSGTSVATADPARLARMVQP